MKKFKIKYLLGRMSWVEEVEADKVEVWYKSTDECTVEITKEGKKTLMGFPGKVLSIEELEDAG